MYQGNHEHEPFYGLIPCWIVMHRQPQALYHSSEIARRFRGSMLILAKGSEPFAHQYELS